MNYDEFLRQKSQLDGMHGFNATFLPDFLFDFQKSLVKWAVRKGRAAIFADCGTGKTPMELVWAQNIVNRTNGKVLILTPLAVAHQHVTEAAKFGIDVFHSRDGKFPETAKIVITNYEQLHRFNSKDFVGIICDESSILKSFEGATKEAVTQFTRKLQYRSLWTATAAPNDYIELGTSSEALGELGYMDMLMRFFKNDTNSISAHRLRRFEQDGKIFDDAQKWRFKGHAEQPFWRWVASWARAMRKPSDLGFEDGKFILPSLIEKDYLIACNSIAPGYLFTLPAVGLKEQRDERRRTIEERCEKAAELVINKKGASVVWCHLNDEGDMLEKLIPNSRQVSGKDSNDKKEEIFEAFSSGELKKLITKPKIGAWGLNWQHCNHVTFFPSHSYEQYYQGVRRCWRFGQKHPVHVDIITTEGELNVMKNLKRKAMQADRMFSNLVAEMNDAVSIDKNIQFKNKEENPLWL